MQAAQEIFRELVLKAGIKYVLLVGNGLRAAEGKLIGVGQGVGRVQCRLGAKSAVFDIHLAKGIGVVGSQPELLRNDLVSDGKTDGIGPVVGLRHPLALFPGPGPKLTGGIQTRADRSELVVLVELQPPLR